MSDQKQPSLDSLISGLAPEQTRIGDVPQGLYRLTKNGAIQVVCGVRGAWGFVYHADEWMAFQRTTGLTLPGFEAFVRSNAEEIRSRRAAHAAAKAGK